MESSGQNLNFDGPVVLVVMDGVGLGHALAGNAVKQARLGFLHNAYAKYPHIDLAASGEAVGLLPGMMGNSEVGHNTMGTGQIVKQGIASIEEAFSSGKIWEGNVWQDAIKNVLDHNSTLHFGGIFSDGGVHSDINQLDKMIEKANEMGVKKIRLHIATDGRDVAPQSEPKYIDRIESFFKLFPDTDYKIASGGGRMVFISDRYQSDWGVVKAGWDAMVHGEAPNYFESAKEAVEHFRKKGPEIQDQYLPPFVIKKDGEPVGKVQDGDSFIYFDFRADRAIEIAMAFTYNDFPYFDRGNKPDVYFAGMTEYNSDTHVPEHQLVAPVQYRNALNEFLGNRQISQLAISETVKFGHITYYFNGNSYNKYPLEEHIEIPSYTLPFDTRPWMKAAEITDVALDEMDKFKFVRLNYPNGDMVGHFADMDSTIVAMEAIDLQLKRLAKKVDELGGMLIVTADHGNAEELIDEDGQPKTSHTTNPVPCIFYDNTKNAGKYQIKNIENAGLANLAATIATLLGQKDLPSEWQPSLIDVIK